jgi:predicted amidohydrolase YtcJ
LLDRDLYQIKPADIDKARVVLTVMDGQVVWQAK